MQVVDAHDSDSRWLTVNEVAARLHVSRDTVEQWINTGDLLAVNVGSRRSKKSCRSSWRISVQGLEDFLNARANSMPMPPPTRPPRRRNPSFIEFIK